MLVKGAPAHRIAHHSTKLLANIWDFISLGGYVSRHVRTDNRADTVVWTLSIFHKENRLEELQYSNLCNGFLSLTHTVKSVVMDFFLWIFYCCLLGIIHKSSVLARDRAFHRQCRLWSEPDIQFIITIAMPLKWSNTFMFMEFFGKHFCVKGMFWYTC